MPLTEEVRDAIKQAAAEAVEETLCKHTTLTKDDVKTVVGETLRQTLVSFGLDGGDPLALQKDFQHLRAWRESVETVKRKGLLAAAGIVVAGALGLLWLGFLAVVNGGGVPPAR